MKVGKKMALEKILFGTYTKGASKGIYTANLDNTTGLLQDAKLVAELGSPTYLHLSKAGYLYAINKKSSDRGGISVYDYRDGDQAVLIQEILTEGRSPAYVSMDEERQLFFVTNYHKGTIESFAVQADGTLTLLDRFKSWGQGPRPEQDKARLHFTNLTPDKRLVSVDLGADKVYTLNISDEGIFELVATYQAGSGFGPRHIRFSPDGEYAYLVGELSSLLSVLKYDQTDGSFTLLQTVSTIPADWDSHNGGAAVRLSDDGRFVYTSNRGHNSIAVWAIDQNTHKVSLVQTISTEGEFPRDFNLNADQSYLVAGNQDTDNITVYRRDAQSGELTLVQKDFNVPEAINVEFV